jgi:hypothetical protein
MKIESYLPSGSKVVQEVVAVLAATVVVAWIISRSPALQKLVRPNSLPNPLE